MTTTTSKQKTNSAASENKFESLHWKINMKQEKSNFETRRFSSGNDNMHTTANDFNLIQDDRDCFKSTTMLNTTNSRHKQSAENDRLMNRNPQSCYTCCCRCSAALPQQGTTSGRSHKSRRNSINNRSPSLLPSLVVVVFALLCSSTTFLHQANTSAVVRPTIFKSDDGDLPAAPITPSSPQATAAASNSAAVASQAAAVTTGQQQPITVQQQQSNQVQHHLTGLQADASQAPQQQQIVPTNKIIPLKSRFCANSNGLRLDSPLGMESMAIDDLSLTASSSNNEQVRPHLARLNLDILGGAWCPMNPISQRNHGKEWIQVKLNRSYVINSIETQGRVAMAGREFVPFYSIEYSRNNGQTWHRWKDFHNSHLLKANDDNNSPVRNELSPPIVGANVIRIVPFSHHYRTVCLRFELYGCQYDEGAPIAYSMMDGVVDPRWGVLADFSYDGLKQRSQLQNGPSQLTAGLGQLVDGVKGPDNFSFNSGFEWIGWKSMNGDVVIEFTFKTLRNFTGALFHSNNLFSNGVEVFQDVDVHYGIDVNLSFDQLKDSLMEQRRRTGDSQQQQFSSVRGELQQTLWSPDVMSIEYMPDKKVETSRPVTVHLKQRLANKLRFVLKFASKWILVSEVEFLSHPIELMSLASLNDQLTPQLMAALAPAKTYDEYVAILREHQLRRIATDAYLESFSSTVSSSTTSTSTTTSSSSTSSDNLNDQQQAGAVSEPTNTNLPTEQQQRPASLDEYFGEQTALINKRINGVQWQQPQQDYPATNPQFNPSSSLSSIYQPTQPAFIGQSPPQLDSKLDLTSPQTTTTFGEQQTRQRTVGVATVISFALIAILVVLALLFAISSRLRHQQQSKLGATQLQRQWYGPAKGFMSNVLASSSSSAGNATVEQQHHHLNLHQQLQQQQMVDPSLASDSHYNPLFANSVQSSDGSLRNGNNNCSSGPLSTLKRLATLTSGSSNKHHQQSNLLFNTTSRHHQQRQHANQLLVSLKDTQQNKPSQQQSINTQLIVGLNQVNPLAQQQIYNSQQTYATHYSTSMSMASGSSTNGGQQGGDYSGADYAIPDGQPIINPGSVTTLRQPLFQANDQQHLNQAFSHHQHHHQQQQQRPGNFKGGDFALQKQLQLINQQRNGSSFRGDRFVVPQQQRPPLLAEHNYELIDAGNEQHQQPSVQAAFATHQRNMAAPVMMHQRTLSNNQQQQQQQCQAFNSMTLNNNQIMRARQQQQQLLSPNGSASGQTTTTTSANSSSSGAAGDGTTASHYYYSSTEAAKSCQLDKN